MADFVVQLGSVVFQGFEVPERIPFGGLQMLAVHKLVGGRRVVDAMGADDRPIEWSGRFRGENALARATALDGIRKGGREQLLTWSELRYRVVVERFDADFERFYEIPYTISCVVVEDLAQPNPAGELSTVDDMMSDDMRWAEDLGDVIGDAPLSANLASLGAAISAVDSFVNAPQSVLATVLSPLALAQSTVDDLIDSVGGPLEGLTSILPAGRSDVMVAGLASQVAGFTELSSLLDLQSVLGRMGSNLGAVTASGAQIVQAGGDLYRLAADAYGDATAWAGIARANGLADPILSGLNTLVVPRTASA